MTPSPDQSSNSSTNRPAADRIDEAMTSFARLVRGPRLAGAMGAEAAATIESSLYPVLVGIIDLGPLRLSSLAQHVTLQMSTLSRHASELQSRGLIRREVDPNDHRAANLAVTDEGRELVERVRRAWWSTIEDVVGKWTNEELEAFVRAMDRFRAGVDDLLDAPERP